MHVDKAIIKKGAWVLLDGARRLVYPWLGPAEPIAIALEHDLASAVSHGAYLSSKRERGARSTAKITGPLLEQIIQTPIRDENQLKQHYFWDKLRQLGINIKSVIDQAKKSVNSGK